MRGVNLLPAHGKTHCYGTIRIAGYRKIYLFEHKAQYVNYKAVNPGFCEKIEVTRVPPLVVRVPQFGNP